MGNPYLILYNSACFAAWAYCLYITAITVLLEGGSSPELWKAVETPLKVAQTAAVLEILHSALRLVRSPVLITGVQVFSRIWLLWGIVNLAPEATTTRGITLLKTATLTLQLNFVSLVSAWGLSEVIRYGYFALKEVGCVPSIALWLRYSGFLMLYPLGVSSELSLAWLALPTLHSKHRWSIDMPNRFNFAFDYHLACILIMLLYTPGFPNLYCYMLAQRRKLLGAQSQAKPKQQ